MVSGDLGAVLSLGVGGKLWVALEAWWMACSVISSDITHPQHTLLLAPGTVDARHTRCNNFNSRSWVLTLSKELDLQLTPGHGTCFLNLEKLYFS